MNVILLAAGFGTRLGDLGKNTPKAFLPLGRNAAIDRVLGMLTSPSIKNIHVVHNGRWSSMFRRWRCSLVYSADAGVLAKDTSPYVKLHSDAAMSDDDKLGAVGDLEFALARMGAPRDFLLVLADNICTFSIQPFLFEVSQRPYAVWLTLRKSSPEQSGSLGSVTFMSDTKTTGQILGFHEKEEQTSDTPSWSWLGPAWFPSAAIPRIHEYCTERRAVNKDVDRLGDLIHWLVDNSTMGERPVPVWGWTSTDGRAFEIGTPHGYEEAVGYFGRK